MYNYRIYTDGAYSGKRNQGGIGIAVLRCDDEELTLVHDYSRYYIRTTNNRMELKAIIVALKSIKNKVGDVVIVSDSQYAIKGATGENQRIKNLDMWREYDKVFENTSKLTNSITFEWVKGHDKDYWNNYVDKLASSASNLII